MNSISFTVRLRFCSRLVSTTQKQTFCPTRPVPWICSPSHTVPLPNFRFITLFDTRRCYWCRYCLFSWTASIFFFSNRFSLARHWLKNGHVRNTRTRETERWRAIHWEILTWSTNSHECLPTAARKRPIRCQNKIKWSMVDRDSSFSIFVVVIFICANGPLNTFHSSLSSFSSPAYTMLTL